MNQQDVIESWKTWMRSEGLPEWQVEWFIRKGYAACRFLRDAVHG